MLSRNWVWCSLLKDCYLTDRLKAKNTKRQVLLNADYCNVVRLKDAFNAGKVYSFFIRCRWRACVWINVYLPMQFRRAAWPVATSLANPRKRILAVKDPWSRPRLRRSKTKRRWTTPRTPWRTWGKRSREYSARCKRRSERNKKKKNEKINPSAYSNCSPRRHEYYFYFVNLTGAKKNHYNSKCKQFC